MMHVCFYVCYSDCVGVCDNVCCVSAVVEDSGFFSLGVLKYVVCLYKRCDGCCVFCLYCDAWSCRCSCMESMIVSSCRCCMFVSCVHPVAVLNICCILHDLQFVNAGQGCQRQPYGRGILQSRSHDCFIDMSVSFCLPHPVAIIAFIICSGLCACTEML